LAIFECGDDDDDVSVLVMIDVLKSSMVAMALLRGMLNMFLGVMRKVSFSEMSLYFNTALTLSFDILLSALLAWRTRWVTFQ